MKIPVIINNRNLLTWPKAMLNKIKTFENVGEIYIVDNESTYEPLLEWYESKPCHIIKVNNMGHTAPWACGLVNQLDCPYVVTDPDLGIDNLPSNTLVKLNEKLTSNSSLGKIGIKLDWECITKESPYYNHLQSFDKNRWEKSKIKDEIYIDVHIDTTFALYNVKNYFVGGGSLSHPYTAKHYPWEFTTEQRNDNKEFSFYIKNASSSSSYKIFLNL